MNILCGINSNYLTPFKTLAYSLAESQTETINLYLVSNNLTVEEKSSLEKYLSALQIKVIFVQAPMSIKESLKASTIMKLAQKGLAIETYYRLFLLEYLPETVDRILWLDADTIVLQPLNDFYYKDLTGFWFSAVPDPIEYIEAFYSYANFCKKRISLSSDKKYVNAGVILFNLEELRKSQEFQSQNLIQKIQEVNTPFFDQDLLNILGHNADKILIDEDRTYNFPVYNFPDEWLGQHTVLHFLGNAKPWQYNSDIPASQKFWYFKYYKMAQLFSRLV